MSDNQLTELREQIKTQLQDAGLHAFTFVPERVTPPFAFVGPRDPYLTYEQAAFGGVNVNNQVILVAGKGTNEAAAAELDQMIVTALAALDDDFPAREVDQPGRITISGSGEFLAVSIGLTTEIRLQGGE